MRSWFRENTPWLALTLATAVIFSVFPVNGSLGSDIFWHLKTGDYIVGNYRLPAHDLFTYTVSQDIPWRDTQWLFQIIVSLVFRVGGWNGLIALRAVCVVLLAWVLWSWLRERKASPASAFVSITLILLGCHTRLHVRPELFGYILLALAMRVHDRGLGTQRQWAKIIAIQWIWANAHSSCILGIFIAAVFAAEQFLLTHPRAISKFALLVCLLTGVSLINPNGWVILTYALTESGKTNISEFQAPGWNLLTMSGFYVLLLSLPAFLFEIRQGQRSYKVIAVTFLAESLRMIRFMPNLMIASAPQLTQAWNTWMAPSAKSSFERFTRRAAFVGLALGAVYFGLRESALLHVGLDGSQSPIAAAEFLAHERISGKILNLSNDGSYLLWRLGPNQKVLSFNETRLCGPFIKQPPPPGLAAQWRRLFDKWAPACAVIPCDEKYYFPEGKTVGEIVAGWPDWKLVFWDDRYMVFVKDSPENQEIIRRRTALVFPELIPLSDSPSADAEPLQKLAASADTRDRLKTELERVYVESPGHFRAALALGLWYEANGSPLKALEYYHDAERSFPRCASLMVCLGRWHFTHGNRDFGLRYLSDAAKIAPANPSVLYNLALAQSLAGEAKDATKTIGTILRINPQFEPALVLKRSMVVRTDRP